MRTILLSLALCGAMVAPAAAQSALRALGCDGEGRGARSMNSNSPSHVTFRNSGSGPIRIYWLNFQGHRVFYANIAPGRTHEQNTYITHPWVVTNDPSGRCVAIFMPTEADGLATIR